MLPVRCAGRIPLSLRKSGSYQGTPSGVPTMTPKRTGFSRRYVRKSLQRLKPSRIAAAF